MDIASLKGKPVDDELIAKVAELGARVDSAEAKASKASKESIEGRTKLKADLAKALEKLGVESPDEIDAIPDARGQAEASKQIEAKLRRLERDLAEKSKAHDELSGKYIAERRAKLIADAVAKHGFVDDTAQALIERGIVQEGDEFFFRGADGKQMQLADAAAHIAATRPHLVRPAGGQGGSGFKGGQGSGVNPWSKGAFNLTEQMRVRRENPALADQLKAAAAAQ